MPEAVDILQFAADDLFDAELGDDSDGGQNKDETLEEQGSEPPCRPYLFGNENLGEDEAEGRTSDEESQPKKLKKGKKESRKKSPKSRKIKKADVLAIHSESQRMVRESTVKLPYHMPAFQPITHFLKRVPGLVAEKETNRNTTPKNNTVTPVSPPKAESMIKGKNNPEDILSPLRGDTPTPIGIRANTPKLSAADDPFFLDATPPTSTHVGHSGVQSLMERFMKHATKPQDKARAKEESKTGDVPNKDAPVAVDDKLSSKMPGARLQLLREQLQRKIKVKRAEMRKVQESQRKLDNEEMSEEEEVEEDEETDESTDYELDKWNEEDERKQQEGDSDLEETGDHLKSKAKSTFMDDEADESDNGGNDGYDIDSGSEGDISDGNESDDNDENSSVFSDDQKSSMKKQKTAVPNVVPVKQVEEQTLDLFNDSRSHTDGREVDKLETEKSINEEKESGGSFGSFHLHLDSVEDGEDKAFHFPSSPMNLKVKAKNGKSKSSKSLTYFSEVSQDSGSQSSNHGIMSSELGDSANSSDSCRIPPGQGDSVSKIGRINSGRDTPELFSSFSRFRNLIGASSDGNTQSSKKAGKLSELTLPIEDSQDLFDDECDRNRDNLRREKSVEETSDDFHFCLDEDTQFTQILNTQGFINSTKKSKAQKAKKLFEGETTDDMQPNMKELIGLCSGRFSDGEDSQIDKDSKSQSTRIKCNMFSQLGTQDKQSDMNELLGLCSGRFTDDDGQETEEEVSESKVKKDESAGEPEKIEKDGDRDEGNVEENSDNEEESDPEEMVLKRKCSKKYETKKRGVFDKKNFFEEEAELSGSDVGSDADEDIATDEDVIEEDSDVEELPSDEELQKQINKVHMKSLHDQDSADLRAMKEMFLPDGDLYTDGQGRTRHFRWRGIDENSQFDFFGNKGLWGDEEDAVGTELVSEEEIQRRKERYERETFLREEMSKEKRDLIDIDESSQNILNIIKDTSSKLPEALSNPSAIIVTPKSSAAPVLKRKSSQKGSFLNHSKTTLSRLSSLTSNTPNTSATARGFVFQSVSPASKDQSKSKKIQRTNSVIEAPASKRPRLDRSLSDSSSVFTML